MTTPGRTYVRTWTVLVRVNTGPPTWWKPDVGASLNNGLLILKAGWLRACIQIGIGSRRHPEEEK